MSKENNQSDTPAPFRGEFSFVNKDAGNIDSKDHNAAVSWHVMNRYERWKKQEQAKKLRASANVPVGPLSPPSQQQGQPSQQLHPQTQSRQQHQSVRRVPYMNPRRTALTYNFYQPRTMSTQPPFGFDPWTAETLQLGYPGPNSTQPSSSGLQTSAASTPSTHSSIMTDDPAALLGSLDSQLYPVDNIFDPSLAPVAPLVNNLIGYAYEFLMPSIWPKESERAQHTWELARSWDDIALINQDTCYANAYLSLLAAAMGSLTDDDNLMYQSRVYQGQAMTDLRQRVSGQGNQDLITLKAILKLFSSETLVDNTSTARIHLKMLRNLVQAAGGMILLDSWFREDLLSCDCYFALKFETRPLFPAQEWTPGPLSQPWKARLMSAGIYGDHSAAVDPLIENPLLKAIVTDLRELFKVNEYTRSHDVPSDDQVLRWQQLRRFDCISRLADHHVDLSIYPHLFNWPLLQDYSCIATALMANMVLGSPEPVRFGVKLINDLRRKLVESERGGEEAQFKRLRLWALYVGSLAEKVHMSTEESHCWFEKNYQNLAAGMGLSAWEDAKRVMRQFLISDQLQEEINAGRAHRTSDARQGLYAASGCSWREPLQDSNPVIGESQDDLTGDRRTGKQRADP
ncbi:hypothetical protein LTR84_001469 [Exophiala bonariae]|uniref:Transcription factor domain-containing protein n=1 Tax=Exophiala bonariae TaxID=1690606 RepID=A0AAV9NCP2_9EURO|nr:hypothetical protein LTR84_001469 [Exophiala bonariae]